ncbi:MAG: hypothetical protein J4452_04120 [Candidatus Aenigmarchaeota archaeon]|nr:hypothetical protein [Candidatus Aenigmarchaeota archaeon]
MSFLSWLMRRPKAPESLQSDVKSLESASKSLQISDIPDTVNLSSKPSLSVEYFKPSPPLSLEKESFGLGLAAGFTGKSLREIEYSLNRIENQMTTKDWFLATFEDRTPELLELIRTLDQNGQSRYEAIQSSIDKLKEMSKTLPEPIKSSLSAEISAIELNLPLTPKMEEALSAIKEAVEISYEDLAKRLNLAEVSGLRGLMANMTKRTKNIERFTRGGKGWVKYVEKGDLNLPKSDFKQGEAAFSDVFEAFLRKEGYNIKRKLYQTSPDFIIEKETKLIGVELKVKADATSLQRALGQLLYAKSAYNLDEIWLVMPPHQTIAGDFLKNIQNQSIKTFILDQERLIQV